MDIKLSVDQHKLQAALRKAPQQARNALQKGINAGGIIIQREMIEQAPAHDGRLRQSVEIKSGDLKVKVAPTAKYAPYVEGGTGPHWVGIDKIEKWANDHGISPFAVQRSIATKGTKPNPFVERTFNIKEDHATRKAVSVAERELQRILN